MTFNNNRNIFLSTISQSRNEIHAFETFFIPKAVKTKTQHKNRLIKSVTQTINEMDSDDFGIKVIILKTVQ